MDGMSITYRAAGWSLLPGLVAVMGLGWLARRGEVQFQLLHFFVLPPFPYFGDALFG